jgi:hypothetical protein
MEEGRGTRGRWGWWRSGVRDGNRNGASTGVGGRGGKE